MLGGSILLDFYGVKEEKFHDSRYMEDILKQVILHSGLTLLKISTFQFETRNTSLNNDTQKGGMTGYAMLAESHISIHTWPEYQKVTLDIYTCGDPEKAEHALSYLLKTIKYEYYTEKRVERGVDIQQEVEL